MYIGIGGAMGAMPTIVLQSVPPEQSGQSSAINLVLRNAGTAVGIQLAATILTASLTSAGVPTDRGYTAAFGVATIGCLIAFVLSLKIPRVRLARAKATGPESLAYTPAPSLDV
jgi:MFS family permease